MPPIKIYASFTSTFIALYRGDLTMNQLLEPRARLIFGCVRDHLFNGDLAPKEVTWVSEPGFPTVHNVWEVPYIKVGPESGRLFRILQETIQHKERLGHVRYQGGNLPGMRIVARAAGIEFWWREETEVPPNYSQETDERLLEMLDYEPAFPITDWSDINADVSWALSTGVGNV